MNSCSLLDEKGSFANLMLSFLCRSHSLWRSIPGYDHAHYRRLYPSIIKDIEVEMHCYLCVFLSDKCKSICPFVVLQRVFLTSAI